MPRHREQVSRDVSGGVMTEHRRLILDIAHEASNVARLAKSVASDPNLTHLDLNELKEQLEAVSTCYRALLDWELDSFEVCPDTFRTMLSEVGRDGPTE